ncbi:MAG: PD-(D/E)XK nuclease family protein [Candidatus Cloacimonetes bacterium]|nr:PD-(D/E)XK nuclease family protein [Candidatus Cloacimonadota bacterium]
MKQATLQTFGKPPLPRGYSTSHILTKRKCGHKFLLAYIFKAKGKQTQPLKLGSDVHADIAEGKFISEDPDKQKMLNAALEYLNKMPDNPVFETTFDDKNNPGKFTGTVFESRFMGLFDVHWVDNRIGVDWKTGTMKEDKGDYEIQAYILNELFRQKYKHNLRTFEFVFLKSRDIYEAESIQNGAVRTRTERKIKNALDSIKRYEFEKKVSFGCQWCEYQGMCI